MQTVYSDSDLVSIPRVYRNRPAPTAFNSSCREVLCEVIYLIEGDLQAREEISSCLQAIGIKLVAFATATEYLDFVRRDIAACVILNIRLPDLCGLEMQRRLAETGNLPVVFISNQCDLASTVCALKAGAVDFLTRPFDMSALVTAVRTALAQDRRQRQRRAEVAVLQKRSSLLTPREREVFPLVVGGLLNKQAASVLGISEVTLQIHRSQVMRKMQAESFADLVRIAVKLRIPYWRENKIPNEEVQICLSFSVRNRLIARQPLGV